MMAVPAHRYTTIRPDIFQELIAIIHAMADDEVSGKTDAEVVLAVAGRLHRLLDEIDKRLRGH